MNLQSTRSKFFENTQSGVIVVKAANKICLRLSYSVPQGDGVVCLKRGNEAKIHSK